MKYIFRLYQWVVAAPIILVLTILTALVCLGASGLNGRRWGGYYPPRLWSRCVCRLWFVNVKVAGRENLDPKQAYVFVANHQSAFDIWSVYGYLNHPFKWLMKKSLEKIFLVGPACKTVGHVFVDDSSIHGIKATIEEAKKTLSGNMSLMIFPEGTRTHDGRMIPFKRGAFLLAAEFRLPVVPITIEGAFKAMPRNTYNVTPGSVRITIHKPIFPAENGFDTRKLMAQCRAEINSSLDPENRDV